MWPDALRIAKDYLPAQLPALQVSGQKEIRYFQVRVRQYDYDLQEEFDKIELRSGARGVESYVAQGREWEQQGEFLRAVQAFLKV